MAGQQQVTAMTWDPEGRTQGSGSDFIDDKAWWPPSQESSSFSRNALHTSHWPELHHMATPACKVI